MTGKIIIITFILFFVSFIRVFADTDIKAEVDKTSITIDQTLTYKITITSTEQNIPSPQLPKFKDFDVISKAQSSNFSLAANKVKTVLVYAFVLAPTRTGKFTIEPASVKVKKDTYSSESFEIEARQGKSKPRAPQKERPSLPQGLQPESEEPQIIL